MNKKGFTLIELLATIVIIALISGIGTIAYNVLIKETSNKVFETYRDSLHAEAAYYLAHYPEKVIFNDNRARLTVDDLGINYINNPKNKSDNCIGSYVDITKAYYGSVLSITYNVCLECPNTAFDNSFDKCKEYDN